MLLMSDQQYVIVESFSEIRNRLVIEVLVWRPRDCESVWGPKLDRSRTKRIIGFDPWEEAIVELVLPPGGGQLNN